MKLFLVLFLIIDSLISYAAPDNLNTFQSESFELDTSLPDTTSFSQFWNEFRDNVISNNKQEVIKHLDFPIHAIFPVQFRFAYDCDTVRFINDEKMYGNFDINSNQIIEFYNFVFDPTFQKIIGATTVDRILKKGSQYRCSNGTCIEYQFFPKEYIKVECSSDSNLKFYFRKENNSWKIEIGGI
ncbi:hypothetical protein [Chitinophaga silvatica]|nr:hypothetical protein [Chitinophaga silvatica]